MSDNSPHLSLPFMAAAQAQKHVTFNEALMRLDTVVQLSVDSINNGPPNAPLETSRVIVSETPEGEFIGKENHIASYTDNVWTFDMPSQGWRAFVASEVSLYFYHADAWQALTVEQGTTSGGTGTGTGTGSSDPQTSAPLFGINAAADSYNRLTVKAAASLLDHEGAGHQLKINKASSADTASLLFQNNYTGHAEMGLSGSEDFEIKTSAAGANFKTGLIAHANSGVIEFPNGTHPNLTLPCVDEAGGPEHHYSVPSQMAVYYGRGSQNLTQNRVYFSPFYIDRPTEISGGFIAQSGASTVAGSLLRAGIFDLGLPEGNNWSLGQMLIDFGAKPADVTGEKKYDLATPLTLSPGWYAAAVGVNAINTQIRYARVLHPGQQQLAPSGTDLRFCGPSGYLYKTDVGGEIAAGFTASGLSGTTTDLRATGGFTYMFFIPKWRHV